MGHDTTDSDEAETDTGLLTGSCEHCEWTTAADSHPELVAAYHDHLRAEHPGAWLQV